MERKLDPSVRILKVWKAWGDQKNDVALILRHHHSTDGYIDKRISNKVFRRKSSLHHKLANHEENTEEVQMTEPMERLLKLVLTQGETIQAQLKKLRHQEEQIERYEEQMHRMRSLQDGENYVVESYLRDEKSKKSRKRDKSPRKSVKHRDKEDMCAAAGSEKADLCQATNAPTTTTTTVQTGKEDEQDNSAAEKETDQQQIQEQTELMERICELNTKLTREEERLVKLGLKMKKCVRRHKDEGCEEAEAAKQLMLELESLKGVTSEQSREIELNEQSLTELEVLLDTKHDHVSHLTYQIQLVDEESEFLQQRLLELSHGLHPYPHSHTSFAPLPQTFHNLQSIPSMSNPANFDSGISAGVPVPMQLSPEDKHSDPTMTNSISMHTSSSSSSDNSIVHCQCQHGDSTSPTHNINIHIKPCRDHQDNDSNSDTGISSLHSSGDENTLFVLDTLV